MKLKAEAKVCFDSVKGIESHYTKEQLARWKAGNCPNCDSEDKFYLGEGAVEPGTSEEKYCCDCCGEEWVEIYALVGPVRVTEGEND